MIDIPRSISRSPARMDHRHDDHSAVMALRVIALLAAVLGTASCLFEFTYTVGGIVTGVRGVGLVLEDNSGADLRINASGAFTFQSKIANGGGFAVTVKTQPSNPAQSCTVYNGSGTVAKVDVTNVVVTCSQAARFAYVANQDANTLSAFSIDSVNGILTPVAGSPFPSTGLAPTAVAVDPNGTFLYVANKSSNTVGLYAINDATGTLTIADFAAPAGRAPSALCVDPTGRYLYVANSTDNTVSVYAIQSGQVTPISGSPYAAGIQPVALRTDPGGNFLYVTDFAGGNVTVLAIDSVSGALTGVAGSPFAAGSGSVAVAVDTAGTFAYVANETAATISTYSISTATGALAAVSGSPLSTASAPESITVAAAGNFLYVANVTSINDISTYAIEPGTGALTLTSTSRAGFFPLSVVADPGGQFVYAANHDSGNVSVFSVDAATGALTAVAGSPFAAGAGARSIAVD